MVISVKTNNVVSSEKNPQQAIWCENVTKPEKQRDKNQQRGI